MDDKIETMIADMNKRLKPRDPARIDRIIEKVREHWKSNPDLRLCQIVQQTGAQCLADPNTHDVFHVEDDKFEAALEERMRYTE